MPTQFGGNGGNYITTFGGGLSGDTGSGGGGGITTVNTTLTLATPAIISSATQGNFTVQATTTVPGKPMITAHVAKTGPAQAPTFSIIHNINGSSGDYLVLEWNASSPLTIHLAVGEIAGVAYVIRIY